MARSKGTTEAKAGNGASRPTPEDDVVIRVRGLRTQFGPQVVHDNLDLDVRRGEVLGVVGGSGTGKSVLLKEIIGLITPLPDRSRCSAPTSPG